MSSDDPLWSPGSKIELTEQPPEPRPMFEPTPEAYLLCGLLFLLTCLSTFFVGMGSGGEEPRELTWEVIQSGLSYSVPLMLILLCHEMGHYLQARRHGVPATLPFFIPTPPWFGLFGTMGAVIVQAGGVANRRSLFDIAVSGPIAGFVIALPVTWYGVQHSVVKEIPVPPPGHVRVSFGDPLVLKALVRAKHGVLPPNHDVIAGPLFFAGWVGLFLTGLNLLPVGQLDGGHVLYTLLGKRAHIVALIAWLGMIAYMIYAQYWAYALFVGLLALMGVRHPPTTNDDMPLGTGRTIVGWLTMGLLLICFIPQPVQLHYGPELPVEKVEDPEPGR
jgi:membrane-associated protease RseP (regulator of RpoE activity)